MSKKPENAGGGRDSKGRFTPGHSGNPNGKEPGSLSITSAIKEELEKAPKGKKKTKLQQLVKMIIDKALKDKNDVMIKNIWNYVDGFPKQTAAVEHRGEGIKELTDFFREMALGEKPKKKE